MPRKPVAMQVIGMFRGIANLLICNSYKVNFLLCQPETMYIFRIQLIHQSFKHECFDCRKVGSSLFKELFPTLLYVLSRNPFTWTLES